MANNDIHNYEFDDTLNKYLKGELSKEEESRFIQQLEDNTELKQKAIAIARLASAMNQVGSEQDQDVIAEIQDSNVQTISRIAKVTSETVIGENGGVAASIVTRPRILNFKRLMISFSAAASILLCVFGGYKYYLYNETTNLGREYLVYFPSGDFSRGVDDSLQKQLKGLYQDIDNKKDLNKAISTLETMWEQSQSEIYNNYTEAMPEIGWMLANAYLRDNESKQALDVLSVLADEYPVDTVMGEKVRELITRINKL